jgi:tripartite-type tricarboxylate transporter receptor subunit TctC
MINIQCRDAVARGLVALMLAASAGLAMAGTFPDRPVRLVVAGPPSGGTDFLARVLAERLTAMWKQPVVVENRAGASGLIGTQYVRSAPADGYTLILGHAATHAIVPAMHHPSPYDPIRDFTPISLVGTAPEVLVVAANSPIKSLPDLIAAARAKPGTLTYGSPGIGLPQHLLGYRMAQLAGVDMRHVPYRGSNPALTDLIGGQISAMVVTTGAVIPFIKDGRVRAIAVNSAQRSPLLPDVPTFNEEGMPELQQLGWFGVFAPAGVPPEIAATLNGAIAKVLAEPDVRARISALYVDPVGDTQQQFAAFHREEVRKWAQIVKESGVRAE